MNINESESNSLTRVVDNIWTLDDSLTRAGVRLPIRMTVIRLADGGLLLHSPTRYSPAVREILEGYGTIKYLMAPNIAHWVCIPMWQKALPEVTTLAAPGLKGRRQIQRAGLRIDRELLDGSPEEWAGEMESVLISAPLYSEVALFHKPSRTLVLTDLVQNLPPEDLPSGLRAIARVLGITAPGGKAPAYLRFLLRRGGRAARVAAARLVAFKPERVIFAHGNWYGVNATERLRGALQWLLPPSAGRADGTNNGELRGTRVVSQITKIAAALGFAAVAVGTVSLLRRRRSKS